MELDGSILEGDRTVHYWSRLFIGDLGYKKHRDGRSAMLNVQLDPETEAYLTEILQHEKTSPDELIQTLIRQRWIRLQSNQTLVEKRGGHPEHLLQDADPNLSERQNRKRAIAEHRP